MADPLTRPVTLGAFELDNPIVMAPLTRARAGADGVPGPLAPEYYRQRASAGLLITEATNISAVARGFADTPGIYTEAHVEGWGPVTDAVHREGGLIVCQLWHTGRVSHESLHPGHANASSSDGACDQCRAWVITDGVGGRVPTTTAVALTEAGIRSTVADYARAARFAMDAGFDGVEVHAANGYLLQQFLADNVNRRTDNYGGSPANRGRIVREVVAAVAAAIGADRTGIRISPVFGGNGIADSDPAATYRTLLADLDPVGLAYVHVADSGTMMPGAKPRMDEILDIIGDTGRPLVLNGAFDGPRARAALAAGHGAAIAFGRPFISNPDLVARLRGDLPLTPPDPATFYGGGARGYTDYPTLSVSRRSP